MRILVRVLCSAIFLAVSAILILLFVGLRRVPSPPQNTVVVKPFSPPIQYYCPLLTVQPLEVATCTDCTLYPVDKSHRLPATYAPHVVDVGLPGGGAVLPVVKPDLTALFADAKQHGLSPMIVSAYRSYDLQVEIFQGWVAQEAQKSGSWLIGFLNAARYSALPGHSEHQLGTAVDLNCQGCVAFDRNDARNIALWDYLEQNAYRFGFVISYPRDDEGRTGYQDEPWHLRYVGREYAAELMAQDYLHGSGACAAGLLRTKEQFDHLAVSR